MSKCPVCGRGWSREGKLLLGAAGSAVGGVVLWMMAAYFTGSVGFAAFCLLAGIGGVVCCLGEAFG